MDVGLPRTALDPTWTVDEVRQQCDGELHLETTQHGATGWWWCKKCGWCGRAHVAQHLGVIHPNDYLRQSLELFYKRKREEGLPEDLIQMHAAFLQGAVLRYASTLPATGLEDYYQQHIVLR
jgi:hypothetical protein